VDSRCTPLTLKRCGGGILKWPEAWVDSGSTIGLSQDYWPAVEPGYSVQSGGVWHKICVEDTSVPTYQELFSSSARPTHNTITTETSTWISLWLHPTSVQRTMAFPLQTDIR
jgi:hypothetical protein